MNADWTLADIERHVARLIRERDAAEADVARLTGIVQAVETPETRVEYGHMTEQIGWVHEVRGIKYASHQRTVHFRVDEPVLIDHWTYADHRHPVQGCTFCAGLALIGKVPLTTRATLTGGTDEHS